MSPIFGCDIGVRDKYQVALERDCAAKHIYAEKSARIGLVTLYETFVDCPMFSMNIHQKQFD